MRPTPFTHSNWKGLSTRTWFQYFFHFLFWLWKPYSNVTAMKLGLQVEADCNKPVFVLTSLHQQKMSACKKTLSVKLNMLKFHTTTREHWGSVHITEGIGTAKANPRCLENTWYASMPRCSSFNALETPNKLIKAMMVVLKSLRGLAIEPSSTIIRNPAIHAFNRHNLKPPCDARV